MYWFFGINWRTFIFAIRYGYDWYSRRGCVVDSYRMLFAVVMMMVVVMMDCLSVVILWANLKSQNSWVNVLYRFSCNNRWIWERVWKESIFKSEAFHFSSMNENENSGQFYDNIIFIYKLCTICEILLQLSMNAKSYYKKLTCWWGGCCQWALEFGLWFLLLPLLT